MNEDALLDALSPLGVERVQLEALSFSEQAELFYDAEIVVGGHGAGLGNVIYGDHLALIELHPRSVMAPSFYYAAKARGHVYRQWSAGISAPHNRIDFEVRVPAVVDMVESVL